MARRLVDEYRRDDQVEVYFEREDFSGWQRGQVVALQHPGVWVRTMDGKLWFVTNTRRIRKVPASC